MSVGMLVCQKVCVVQLFRDWTLHTEPILCREQYSYKLVIVRLSICVCLKRPEGGSHPNDSIAWTGRKHKSNLFHWKRKEFPPPPSSSFLFLPCPPPSSNSPTQQLFLSLSALPPPCTPACSPTGPSVMALFYCCAAFGRETPVWSGQGVRPPLNAGV